MDYRILGRTGVQVSPLCLGAMMFGAGATRTTTTAIRIIHRALDAGINFVDTADVYSRGESEQIVGKALAGPARRRGPRDQGPHADGRGPQPAAATRAAGSSARSRTRCAAWRPTGSTSTRSTAPTPTPTSRRRSARSRDLVRAGQGPLHRLLHVPGQRRSSRRSGSRASAASSASSASSRPTRSSCAGSRRTCCRPAGATAWA